MTHPSMGPDEEEPDGLPEGVTREKVEALIREVIEKAQMIGLYATPGVEIHGHDDVMFFAMRFDIGQLAWSKRVQDPKQDEFDTKLRDMENPMVKENTQGIKDRFLDD